ncbi:Pal1 protein [Pichia kluyveri]|uniref:Pal1 protein n=1 Tax=Pichia kluyveri TaxID=36015 RepID=A0AAV5RB64_PICKL|nr:Pal1 protein [Pichia kluyveri]
MYNHNNQSTTSTGSGRRISTNNPFRTALLQEERQKQRSSSSPTIDDAQYNNWLNQQRIEEEENERSRVYSDDDDYYDDDDNDANSFTEGDEYDRMVKPPTQQRPEANRSRSGSNRRDSYNPFATNAKPHRSNSGTPVHTPSRSSFSDAIPSPDFVPPPAYDEVVTTKKYAKDEYPRDEKNPFPSSERSEAPVRAKTISTRRPAPAVPSSQYKSSNSARLNPESMTNTTSTRIMSDGRVRSKSTGDPYNTRERSHSNRDGSRQNRSGQSNHRYSEDGEERKKDKDRHRERSHKSGNRKKKFVQERSKNLDTIDKLDVTGFFGGGKFHHDGPFDACTPQRNKGTRVAPVDAFPIDGPNNSIKGMAPTNRKNEQYDMVFGIDNTNEYDADYPVPAKKGSVKPPRPGYSNGVVVKRADSADLQSLLPGVDKEVIQTDPNASHKLHGDTTLGLGDSTFVDGAPAYGAHQSSTNSGGLSRKKTFLGRMKTIVRK